MNHRDFFSIADAAKRLGLSVEDIEYKIETGQISTVARCRSYLLDGTETKHTKERIIYTALSPTQACSVLWHENTQPFHVEGWSEEAVSQAMLETKLTRTEVLRDDSLSIRVGRITKFGFPGLPLKIPKSEVDRLKDKDTGKLDHRRRQTYLTFIAALVKYLRVPTRASRVAEELRVVLDAQMIDQITDLLSPTCAVTEVNDNTLEDDDTIRSVFNALTRLAAHVGGNGAGTAEKPNRKFIADTLLTPFLPPVIEGRRQGYGYQAFNKCFGDSR